MNFVSRVDTEREFSLSAGGTVGDLRGAIFREWGVTVADQRLIFDGKEVGGGGGNCLRDLGVSDGANFSLIELRNGVPVKRGHQPIAMEPTASTASPPELTVEATTTDNDINVTGEKSTTDQVAQDLASFIAARGGTISTKEMSAFYEAFPDHKPRLQGGAGVRNFVRKFASIFEWVLGVESGRRAITRRVGGFCKK